MRHTFIAILLCSLISIPAKGDITIEECVNKAIANYPAIRKYELLESTKNIELSDINKGWLPRIDVYGQATGQNVVPSFPETLSDVLEKMGQDVKGLGKIQYRIGVDLSQMLWDGGVSKVKREMSRAEERLQRSILDVELYEVRQRVENLFFAILLAEEQVKQSLITLDLLNNNHARLESMHRNGVAMQSDVDMVEAQALSVNQNIIRARSAIQGYRNTLAIFIGTEKLSDKLAMPASEIPSGDESERPELGMFQRQMELNCLRDRMTKASLMPRVGFFAQAYYGYPGLDYFKSMMNRDLSFNLVAGLKVTWNLDPLYTKKNRAAGTAIKNNEIETDKETFLFNTRLKATSQNETITGIEEMMRDDTRIVNLRSAVRKAAESQLENGIIDTTALLAKISEENTAMLTSRYHEIMLLQEIYNLKYTLNR